MNVTPSSLLSEEPYKTIIATIFGALIPSIFSVPINIISTQLQPTILISYSNLIWCCSGFSILGIGICYFSFRNELNTLRKDATIDPQTGLLNKQQANKIVDDKIYQAKKENKPFSLIFLDIDDFKSINLDCYKNADSIMAQMGTLLKKRMQGNEYAIRWGGDECLVVSDIGTNINQGIGFAESLRKLVENHKFYCNNIEKRITISCGVTVYNNNETYDDLFLKASEACKNAKKPRTDGSKNTVNAIVKCPKKK